MFFLISRQLSAAPPAADGAAADGAAAAADVRAGGDQRGDSARRQHGRHGGPSCQEDENRPDGAEKVHQHQHQHLIQVHGEEVQLHLVLLIVCPPEHSQDVDV